jgi:hypothetical protein
MIQYQKDMEDYNYLDNKYVSGEITEQELNKLNDLAGRLNKGTANGFKIVLDATEKYGTKEQANIVRGLKGGTDVYKGLKGVLKAQVGFGAIGLTGLTSLKPVKSVLGIFSKPLVVVPAVTLGGASYGVREYKGTGDIRLAVASGVGMTVGLVGGIYSQQIIDKISKVKIPKDFFFKNKKGMKAVTQQYGDEVVEVYYNCQKVRMLKSEAIARGLYKTTAEDVAKYLETNAVNTEQKFAKARFLLKNIKDPQDFQKALKLIDKVYGRDFLTDLLAQDYGVIAKGAGIKPPKVVQESAYAGKGTYETTDFAGVTRTKLVYGGKIADVKQSLISPFMTKTKAKKQMELMSNYYHRHRPTYYLE